MSTSKEFFIIFIPFDADHRAFSSPDGRLIFGAHGIAAGGITVLFALDKVNGLIFSANTVCYPARVGWRNAISVMVASGILIGSVVLFGLFSSGNGDCPDFPLTIFARLMTWCRLGRRCRILSVPTSEAAGPWDGSDSRIGGVHYGAMATLGFFAGADS